MKRWHVLSLFIFIGLWVFVQIRSGQNPGTVYSAQPQGTKALFLLFQSLGYDAQSWLYPANKLDLEEMNATLFIIAPNKPVYSKHILNWIDAGNRLVYMGPVSPERFLKADIELDNSTESTKQTTETSTEGTEKEATATLEEEKEEQTFGDFLDQVQQRISLKDVPFKLQCQETFPHVCQGVRQISSMIQGVLPMPEDAQLLAGTHEKPLIAQLKHGKGEIWFFSDHTLAANKTVDRYDNLRLLFQIATKGAPVYFDEFHHGYYAPTAANLKSKQDALYLFASYLTALLIIVALCRAVRFGAPLAEQERSPSSTVEFAAASGLLYREHRANSVLEHYVTAWRSRVEKTFGVSHRVGHDSLVTELERDNVLTKTQSAAVRGALKTLTSAKPTSQNDLEKSVKEIEAIFPT